MRGPGEGSVDFYKSKWRVRVTTTSGEQRYLGTYPTREEAESVPRGALAELAESMRAPIGGVTLRAWGEIYLDRRERDGRRNMVTDRQRWRSHVLTASFADDPIKTIRPRDVRQWVKDMRTKKTAHLHPGKRGTKPLSSQPIKHCLNLLRVCLQSAVEEELLDTNPAEDVKPPPRELRTDEPWTFLEPHEPTALLTCPHIDEAERMLMGVAIGTGTREGELWNNELDDLHLNEEEPFVFVRYGSKGKPPKNGKTRRVPLFGLALASMRRRVDLLPTYATCNPQGLIFPTKRGCRRPKGRYRGWQKFLRAAGILRSVRFHDLRHTCASSLVAGWWGRKWRLDEVRDLLGHSSVTVTERYAHLAETALKGAARETEQALCLGNLKETESGSRVQTPVFLARHSGFEPLAFGSGDRWRSPEKSAA